MARFCTKCGASMADEMRFCTSCGTPVSTQEPATEPVQTEETAPAEEGVTTVGEMSEDNMPDAPGQTPQAPPPPPRASAPPPQSRPAYQPQQPVYQQAQPVYHQPTYQQPVYHPPAAPQAGETPPPKGSKYEPITTGGFIGIMLLMCIPLIGIILTIVWACGGCRKVQKRNLARASLILIAVGLVISLVLGFAAKGIVNKAAKEIGITQSEGSGGLLGGLLGGDDNGKASSGGLLGGLLGDGESQTQSGGILGILGSLGGNDSTGNDELDELQDLLGQLEGLTGQDMGGDELIDEIGDINKEASKNSSGWPSDLPNFPSGTMSEVENYRTEFSGTTLEDTKAYIETLKGLGYEYQDFYDFGMSEADMLEYGGWWGTNGKWYISISHAEGVTTIDHVTELPDMSDLLG